MAKLEIGNGLDDMIVEFGKLSKTISGVSKEAVYVGAGVAADEVRRQIESLKHLQPYEKQALLDGLGIAKIRQSPEDTNTLVGFSGYSDHKTKSYPEGIPIPMLARAINSGTSWRQKQPFVAKAVRKCKAAVEKAMAEVFEKKLKS